MPHISATFPNKAWCKSGSRWVCFPGFFQDVKIKWGGVAAVGVLGGVFAPTLVGLVGWLG